MWSGMRTLTLLALLCLGPDAALAQPAPPQTPPPDGLHATPSLYWQDGDHRVDLGLSTRFRTESWEAFTDDTSWYNGTRTRVRMQYGWRNQILAVGEFQDVRLHGMDADGTGALANYRNANGGGSHASSDVMRTLYLETRPMAKTFLRGGRQDVKLDSQEVQYAEPNWRYLRSARLGERLVGTVGWSHVGARVRRLSRPGWTSPASSCSPSARGRRRASSRSSTRTGR